MVSIVQGKCQFKFHSLCYGNQNNENNLQQRKYLINRFVVSAMFATVKYKRMWSNLKISIDINLSLEKVVVTLIPLSQIWNRQINFQ